jgi:hypothetical protein
MSSVVWQLPHGPAAIGAAQFPSQSSRELWESTGSFDWLGIDAVLMKKLLSNPDCTRLRVAPATMDCTIQVLVQEISGCVNSRSDITPRPAQ